MLKLTKVLPIKIRLNEQGKKIPIGGMKAENRIMYEEGMKNFAIYLADYPDIVVLDLDTRDHPLDFYKDKTYTHKTRKGWHCFFKNTFNITSKRQKQKDKFDLLAGHNWCFYDYNDPGVAQYLEHNQLPIVDMPQELYEAVKTRAKDLGENTLKRFISSPLMDHLKSGDTNLWDHKHSKWRIDNSSDLAWAVVKELIPYTDEIEHIRTILDEIDQIGDKHSTDGYISRLINDAKHDTSTTKKINWRPLTDFRAVYLGNKVMYADIDRNTVEDKSFIKFCSAPHTKVNKLEEFVEIYPQVEFAPHLANKFNENVYNLFNGFIEPEEGPGHEQYLDYILHVICRNNSEYYDYLIKYMAHMVQKPSEKPDVAIVLFGESKGTGKDTFHEMLGEIFKSGGYNHLTEKTLMGGFNRVLETTLLGVAEELVFGGSHREDSRLKSLITAAKHEIERKGIDTFSVANYIRLIVTSNSARPVRATDGERRYFALSPSFSRKGDISYWSRLRSNFNPRHLMHYLSTLDISTDEFNPRNYPATEFLQEIIDMNKDKTVEGIEMWWEEVKHDDWVDTKEVYEEIVVDQKYMTYRQFSRKLFNVVGKENLKKSFNKDRGNGYKAIKD